MAPLSFLKSSSSSSPAPAPSPGPGSSQNRNCSPSPEPTSTSRYNPARLLRRKASFSHKSSSAQSPARTSVDSHPPVPSMIGGSEVESSEHETEEPRTASSAFFSDIGDPPVSGVGLGFGGVGMRGGEFEVLANRTFGSPRSKRDGGIWSGGGTVLMDVIPDNSKPSQQSPSRPQFSSESGSERPTPATPSSRRIMEPAELFLADPPSSSRQLDGASTHLGSARSVTPPVPPLDHPFYPTALSPPRRPMPKSSPRPNRVTPPLQPPQLVSSSSFSAFPPEARPKHTSSPSLDGKSGNASGSGNGLIVDLQDPPVEPRRPVVSAEWLARKPSSSSSASKLGRKNSIGAEKISRASVAQSHATASASASPISKRQTPQRNRSLRQAHALQAGTDSDSPSISQDSDADVGVGTGIVGKRRSISARDGYEVEVTCDDSSWPGPEDEAGEMTWQVKIRRQPRPASAADGQDHYVPTVAPSSPLQLSTAKSRATAPGTASSINLSLSLDQPTGKLVFIAFPMDLHATPRRRGSTNAAARRPPGPPTPPLPPSPRDLFSAGANTATNNATADAPPLPTSAAPPSTPPQPPAFQPSTPQSRSSSRLDRPEYPVTPTRVRLSGQFSPAANGSGGYASPRSRGSSSIARSLSPAFSNGTPGSIGPNGYISPGTYSTPTGSAARRTRLVSAPDLQGGLYAPGTVDGLSEELEGSSLGHR